MKEHDKQLRLAFGTMVLPALLFAGEFFGILELESVRSKQRKQYCQNLKIWSFCTVCCGTNWINTHFPSNFATLGREITASLGEIAISKWNGPTELIPETWYRANFKIFSCEK